jgi:biotin carboxyl carrier protein
LRRAGWYLVHKSRAAGQTKVLATARVGRETVSRVLEATGIIKAQVGASVKIGARATGTISRVYVRVGDAVKKGQVVAEIDARELTAQREEAEARLKLAEAKAKFTGITLPGTRPSPSKACKPRACWTRASRTTASPGPRPPPPAPPCAPWTSLISYTKIVSPIDGLVSQVTAQEG